MDTTIRDVMDNVFVRSSKEYGLLLHVHAQVNILDLLQL